METQQETWQALRERHGKTYGIAEPKRFENPLVVIRDTDSALGIYMQQAKTAVAVVTGPWNETTGAWIALRECYEGEPRLDDILQPTGGKSALLETEPLAQGENAEMLLKTISDRRDLAHIVAGMNLYINSSPTG